MCGIAGKVYAERERGVSEQLLRDMCAAMVHRGPDDEGVLTLGNAGLCMRRLRVIDLDSGRQPMANEDESLWIVFNGEIYNYRELREQLESRGHVFRTASDTETILHLYEEKGVNCLDDLSGMFAFAIWDKKRESLILARDRIGKKPLFYALQNDALTFASELPTVMCDRTVDDAVDVHAADEFLTYLFVPHPRTIYAAVKKLPPASYAVYCQGGLDIKRYWDLDDAGPVEPESENLTAELDGLLRAAVEERLVADVPLGAFLSGGLDSSLIVALMQRQTSRPVKTFSIGFSEASFDEQKYARRVAAHLGTDHEEFTVDYNITELFPTMLAHFGEPFADSSAIPTYHLSRVTRDSVTVALSGDGGDEVFGGYRRYQARIAADRFNRWPKLCTRGIETWARGLKEPTTYYAKSWRKKLKRFLEYAAAVRENPETSWAFFLSGEQKAELYADEFAETLHAEPGAPSFNPYVEERGAGFDMQRLDIRTYLPDDILVKVDRMSMARSLEVRCPFLDHRLVEFMQRLPREYKYNLRASKILLRRVASSYLPREILERPKQGFSVPLAAWLQGELRSWMEDILCGRDCSQRGILRPQAVRDMIARHTSGQRDLSQQLWALVVLESWFQGVGRGQVAASLKTG